MDKGNLETAELLDSIKFKAIESYLTLEKKLLPLCMDFPNDKRVRVIFCVVMIIKAALSRFINLKTSDNKDYFYDEIKVCSPYEYTRYISQFTV